MSTSFKEQVLGLLLIFPWDSFLGGMSLGPRLSTMDSQFNLAGTIQAKISIVLTGNISFVWL